MQAPLESLVSTLYHRFRREAEAESEPSHLFSVAADLVVSLTPSERSAQLQRMVQALQLCTTNRSSEEELCSAALLCSSSALLVFEIVCRDRSSSDGDDDNSSGGNNNNNNNNNQPETNGGVASSSQSEKLWRCWETCVLWLLRAHPPLHRSLQAAAAFSAAELIVRGGCSMLLSSVCASVRSGGVDEGCVPIQLAVEVLAQCTALIVAETPWQLTEAALGTNAAPQPAARSKSNKATGKAASSKAGKQPTTGPPGASMPAATVAAARASSTALPISARTIDSLRGDLLSCCLGALAAAGQPREAVVPALICHRVVVPLLLSAGAGALREYEPAVRRLLHHLAEQPGQHDAVVMLIAALFEFLFPSTSAAHEHDFRDAPLLWQTLHDALWYAFTADVDAGHRTSMELRAEYLLKRVVSLTAARDALIPSGGGDSPAVAQFHEWFVWAPHRSASAWAFFFIILEALREYGLHMVQPAMPKLDALVKQLDETLAASSAVTEGGPRGAARGGALHAVWLELLFLKLVEHPNVGVRKLGLQKIWRLPRNVLQHFSLFFLCTYVFRSASDPRLCSELDRVTLAPAAAGSAAPTNFLESKADDGNELSSVPVSVEPIVRDVEVFYGFLFVDCLHSAASRTEAMRLLLRALPGKPSRFTVSVFARVFYYIATSLYSECGASASASEQEQRWSWTRGMILDADVLDGLSRLMRDAVLESAPFWLEVRLTAIFFEALLYFLARDPPTLRRHAGFWRLLALTGPAAQPGGPHFTQVDACGQFATAGASLDARLHNAQLAELSTRLTGQPGTLVHAVLDPVSLVTATQALLTTTAVVPPMELKLMFFLSGSLLHTKEAADRRLLETLVAQVTDAILGFKCRVYGEPGQLLTALGAFVELHHSLSTAGMAAVMPLSALQAISAVIRGHALAALEDGHHAAGELRHAEELDGAVWHTLRTEPWDVLTAAAQSVNTIALLHSPTGAAEQLQVGEKVAFLVSLAARCAQQIRGSNSSEGRGTAAQRAATSASEVRQLAFVVLARNASRLLQCELAGLVQADEGVLLPAAPEETAVGCFIKLTAAEAAAHVTTLMHALVDRVAATATPSALSALSWATVRTQHARAVYNSIYFLCQHVQPAAHPEVVRHVQEFALAQADQCWTGALVAVFDLLCWSARVARHISGVDARLICESMRGHLRDVGAKQLMRASSLTFAALHYAMQAGHADYVRCVLQEVLEDGQESDRTVYFTAVLVCTEVMASPATNWQPLSDLLLYLAVRYNANREEEENESTLAATEPLMRSWPEALRAVYPPTVRMTAVGRALAISTILWCCGQDSQLATSLTHQLLAMNLTDAEVTHEPCMPNSRTHRMRVRLWQLLCALLPLVPNELATVETIFSSLILHCIRITNRGSVRRFMEVYAIKMLQRQPSLYRIVAAALGEYNLRAQVCGTYVLIASHALLHEEEQQQQGNPLSATPGLYDALFSRLLQQSTSHQHLIRIISHIGIYKVCTARLANNKPLSAETRAVYDYISHADEHVRFREKHEHFLFASVDDACSPREIFCVQRREANMVLREGLPASVFERIRFLEAETRCLIGAVYPLERLRVRQMCSAMNYHALFAKLRDFPYIPHTAHRTESYMNYAPEALALLTGEDHANGVSADVAPAHDAAQNVQRKVSPWWSSEVFNELHPRALSTGRQSLVVVSSLLENPVNIAGLCRCGDIFSIEKLLIPDKSVLTHPHFIAAARSAELWVPWDELAPRDLPGYLSAMRNEGYAIIGIEQTADSVSMADYRFPQRAVVVLGAEGQGIAAPLLPLLDVCVEIPQYGLIRSLNVHVTGAVVMYEYTRQHLMTSPT